MPSSRPHRFRVGGDSQWPKSTAIKKDRDRFQNVTTLGYYGKRPMPLEDRKELLIGLVDSLAPESNFCQMAVASWGTETVHAGIWLLTNCGPGTSLRWLKGNHCDHYDKTTAVKLLTKAAMSFFAAQAFCGRHGGIPCGEKLERSRRDCRESNGNRF